MCIFIYITNQENALQNESINLVGFSYMELQYNKPMLKTQLLFQVLAPRSAETKSKCLPHCFTALFTSKVLSYLWTWK